MIDTKLSDIRRRLDACGAQIMELAVRKFQLSGKSWEQIAGRQDDASDMVILQKEYADFLVLFYQTIAVSMEDTSLRQKIAAIQPLDRGIRRILTASDYPDAENQRNVSREYRILVFFIDPHDASLVGILQERFRWVEQVGVYKKKHGLPVRSPDREQMVIDQATQQCQRLGLPAEFAGILYYHLVLPVACEIEECILGGSAL